MPDNSRWRQNPGIKLALRFLGPVLVGLGAVCLVLGLADLFSVFETLEPPKRFWCLLVGIPLLGIGGTLTSYGFLGEAMRFLSGKTSPAKKDGVPGLNEKPGEDNQPLAPSRGEGREAALVAGGEKPAGLLCCTKCAARSPGDSKFCKFCGEPLAIPAKSNCPHCREALDADTRFCTHCGKSVT